MTCSSGSRTSAKRDPRTPERGRGEGLDRREGVRGLQTEALDLIVRCYARWAARTFVIGTLRYEPAAGHEIPSDVVLDRPDLPSHAAWSEALARAQEFGITMAGRALHGDNLRRFEEAVLADFNPKLAAAQRLPGSLERRRTRLRVRRRRTEG